MYEFEPKRINPADYLLQRDREQAVIIALGKNINIGIDRNRINRSKSKLSLDSKITAAAAGFAFKNDPDLENTDLLIFSTGKTSGSDQPSEAYSEWRFTKGLFPDIPARRVLLENDSTSTGSNGYYTVRMLSELGISRAYVLTVGHHVERSTRNFNAHGKAFGIRFRGVSSDDLLERTNPSNRRLVAHYRRLRRLQLERAKEGLLRFESRIDPYGVVPHLITLPRTR